MNKLTLIMYRATFFLSSVLVLLACSSNTIVLKSNPPKAEIYAQRLGDGNLKKIGSTPFEISTKEFREKMGGDLPVVIEFRLKGYSNKRTVITELPSADLEIGQELDISTGFDSVLQANLIIDGIFEAQKLARAQRFKEALTKLQEVKKSTPELAVIYELEGGVHYMEKDYQKSLDSYYRALMYNPKSSEAIRMTKVLTEKYGVKRVVNKTVPKEGRQPEVKK